MWYGVCKRDGAKIKNCLVDHAPKKLNETGIEDLSVWCSHLVPKDPKEDVLTCCDPEQARDLKENYKMAANIFGRCPSCLHNLVRHMCDYICSPRHAEFIKVKNTKFNDINRKLIIV